MRALERGPHPRRPLTPFDSSIKNRHQRQTFNNLICANYLVLEGTFPTDLHHACATGDALSWTAPAYVHSSVSTAPCRRSPGLTLLVVRAHLPGNRLAFLHLDYWAQERLGQSISAFFIRRKTKAN